MNRLLKDLSIDRAQNPSSALNDRWDSEEEDDDDGDIDIIDRCKRRFFDDNFFFPHSFSFVICLLFSGRKRTWRFCRCYSGSSSRNGGY